MMNGNTLGMMIQGFLDEAQTTSNINSALERLTKKIDGLNLQINLENGSSLDLLGKKLDEVSKAIEKSMSDSFKEAEKQAKKSLGATSKYLDQMKQKATDLSKDSLSLMKSQDYGTFGRTAQTDEYINTIAKINKMQKDMNKMPSLVTDENKQQMSSMIERVGTLKKEIVSYYSSLSKAQKSGTDYIAKQDKLISTMRNEMSSLGMSDSDNKFTATFKQLEDTVNKLKGNKFSIVSDDERAKVEAIVQTLTQVKKQASDYAKEMQKVNQLQSTFDSSKGDNQYYKQAEEQLAKIKNYMVEMNDGGKIIDESQKIMLKEMVDQFRELNTQADNLTKKQDKEVQQIAKTNDYLKQKETILSQIQSDTLNVIKSGAYEGNDSGVNSLINKYKEIKNIINSMKKNPLEVDTDSKKSLESQIASYNKLKKEVSDYTNTMETLKKLEKEIGNKNVSGIFSDSDLKAQVDQIEKIKNTISNTQGGKGGFISQEDKQLVKDMLSDYKKIAQEVDNAKKSQLQSAKEQASNEKYVYEQTQKLLALKEKINTLSKDSNSDDVSINEMLNSYSQIEQKIQEINSKGGVVSPEEVLRVKQMTDGLKQATVQQASQNKEASKAEKSYAKIVEDLESFRKIQGTKIDLLEVNGANLNKINEFKDRLASLDPASENVRQEMRRLKDDISVLGSTMDKSGLHVKSFKDGLLQTVTAFTGIQFAFEEIAQAVKQMVSSMITNTTALSDAIISLTRVTEESQATYDALAKNSYKIADGLGVQAKDLVNSIEEFAKLGYTFEQAQEYAITASKYASAGDMAVKEATDALVASLTVFKDEIRDSMEIADLFNETGNRMSVTSAELGESLTRSANALKNANNNLQESVALTATAMKTVQNPEIVGAGLKTISMRLQSLDEETGNFTSKYQEMVNTITKKYGKEVSFMGANGELQSTYKIVTQLADVWQYMNDTERAFLAEQLSGKTRANVFLSLMNNAEDLTKAMQVARESTGSVAEEMDVIMNTYDKKMEQLKNAWAELSSATLSSDLIKSIIDATTKMLQFVTASGGLVPVLTTIISSIMIIKSQKIANDIVKMGNSLKAMGSSLMAVGSQIKGIATGFKNIGTEGISAIKGIGNATQTTAMLMQGWLVIINLAVTAFSAFYMYQEQQAQKQREMAEANKQMAESYVANIDGVKQLKDRYTEIYNSEMDVHEKAIELNEIQNELTNTYGKQSYQLDLVNGKYAEQIALLEELSLQGSEVAKQTFVDANKTLQNDINAMAWDFGKENAQDKDSKAIWKFNKEQQDELDKIFEYIRIEMAKNENSTFGISSGKNATYLDPLNLLPKDIGTEISMVGSNEEIQQALELMYTKMGNENGALYGTEFYNVVKQRMMDVASANQEILKNQEYINEIDASKLSNQAQYEAGLKTVTDLTQEQYDIYCELVNKSQGFTDEAKQQAIEMASVKEVLEQTVESIESRQSSFNMTDQFKNALSEADPLTDALKQLNTQQTIEEKTLEQLAKKYPQLANSMGSYQEAVSGISSIIAQQNFDEATTKIDDYMKIQEDLQDNNKLTASTIEMLTSKYPELAQHLGSVSELNNALTRAIEEQKNAQQDYYNEVLALDENYYKNKILSDTQLVKDLEASLQKLVDDNGLSYKVDLENYRSIEEAKIAISQQAKSQVSAIWSQFYNATTKMYDIEAFKDSYNVGDLGAEGMSKALEEAYKFNDMQKQINDMLNQPIKQASIGIDVEPKSTANKDKSSKTLSYISQGIEDEIKLVKQKGELLTKEIEILNNRIALTTAKQGANSPLVKNMREQLSTLLDEESKLIEESAKTLRGKAEEYFKQLQNLDPYFAQFKSYEEITEVQLNEINRQFDKSMQGLDSETDSNLKQQLTLSKGAIDEYVNAILTAKSEIESLSSDWFSNANEQLDEFMDKLDTHLNNLKAKQEAGELSLDLKMQIAEENEDNLKMLDLTKEYLKNKMDLQEEYFNAYQTALDKGMSVESDYMRNLKKEYMSLENEIYDYKKKMVQQLIDLDERQVDSVQSLRDAIVKMLRDNLEAENEAYDKQIDALEDKKKAQDDYIEAQKKELDNLKKQHDWENKLAKAKQKLNDLQSDLNSLQFAGNDADLMAEKITLIDEVNTAKEDLQEAYFDRSIEIQEDILDTMKDMYSQDYERQKQEIEAKKEANSNVTDRQLYQQADKMIQSGNMDNIYKQLISWNNKYGDGINATIDKMFNDAKESLNSFDLKNMSVIENLNILSTEAYNLSESFKNIGAMDFEKQQLNANYQEVDLDTIVQSKLGIIQANQGTVVSPLGQLGQDVLMPFAEKILSIPNGEELTSTISKSLTDGVISLMEPLRNIVENTNRDTNVSAPVSVNLNVQGSLDNDTYQKIKRELPTTISNVLQSSLYKLGNTMNISKIK